MSCSRPFRRKAGSKLAEETESRNDVPTQPKRSASGLALLIGAIVIGGGMVLVCIIAFPLPTIALCLVLGLVGGALRRK